ncbi:30S ribosomal protein S6 [Candidatus Collierbacteria bacterium]|nr:30S ribosomal protein S6 [Candidatus Collierbacteria bacterium]
MATLYDLVAVYDTSLTDVAAEKDLVDKVKGRGFKVTEVDKWGVKKLAYEIKKQDKAHYIRLIIEGDEVKELEQDLRINDKLLRYLLIKEDK